MRVAHLQDDETSVLGNRVMDLINTRHVVCIRDFQADANRFTDFLHTLGSPLPAQKPNHPFLDEMTNSNSGHWMDESKAWPLHVDGIMKHVLGEREWLPLTVLYAKNLDQVVGGTTYFYDMAESFLFLSEYLKENLREKKAAYQHPILTGNPLARNVPYVRREKYTNYEFFLYDAWFLRFFERSEPIPLGEEEGDVVHKSNVKFLLSPTARYDHVWKPNDVLIWTNEGFTHGRTEIKSGNRTMWRALVEDPEKPRARYYPKDIIDA